MGGGIQLSSKIVLELFRIWESTCRLDVFRFQVLQMAYDKVIDGCRVGMI